MGRVTEYLILNKLVGKVHKLAPSDIRTSLCDGLQSEEAPVGVVLGKQAWMWNICHLGVDIVVAWNAAIET